MAHSHHGHREHQVSHRRVHHILKHEPDGAKHHSRSHAFSKVTSKTAAEKHDAHVAGKKAPKRYARGGKVKGHHTTNVIIAMPRHPSPAGMTPPMAGPTAGAPPMPPMGGAPGPVPPMPMRKHGGKITAGAATGVGREQKAARAKRGK